MPWLYLLAAGVFEIGFAIGLKSTDGFTRLWPSVITIGAAAISLWLLTQALKTIPVGTAYAIWTGIGAVGAATLGILVYSESASPSRLACIAVIVAGVIGLKLTSAAWHACFADWLLVQKQARDRRLQVSHKNGTEMPARDTRRTAQKR